MLILHQAWTEGVNGSMSFGAEESFAEMGAFMRVVKYLRWTWRAWRDTWRFSWDEYVGPDYHRWESKMEIRRRLSSPPQAR
jgi:hypothetical protein